MNNQIFACLLGVLLLFPVQNQAASFLYVHGDVGDDGTVPSGGNPFHQMLLTDSGSRGLSQFRQLVEGKGHTISQRYDQTLTFDAELLGSVDAIIFGLHQKIWPVAEKEALHTWLEAGGCILIYSDSAAGGLWSKVGAQNPVGQTVVNNLISRYDMQVTVDQANGVRAIRPGPDPTHPIVAGRPVLEGEGVSPVAVKPGSGAQILIPYVNHSDYVVSGTPSIPHQQNITIQNPDWAALVVKNVGLGRIIVLFDRQPMWNAGEGSDISKRDNRLILERIVDELARRPPPFARWLHRHGLLEADLDEPSLVKGGRLVTPAVAYLLGENPHDPNDVLQVHEMLSSPLNDSVTLVWPTLPDRVYQLRISPDLSPDSWMDFHEPFTGHGGLQTMEIPVPEAGRIFARMVVSH